MAEIQDATGPDPCDLVSATEMEALIGPMGEPPYRVDSQRRPDPTGDGCFYRARDGRNVTIEADWETGPMSFQMMAGTGADIADVLYGYEATTDTLAGDWDRIGATFGRLIVLKDSVSVEVDPLASQIGLPGAVRVASLALSRLDSPLAYDGAKATRKRSEPALVDRNPCDLITRQEVEAVAGPLREDPTPSEDGSDCDYVTTEEMFGEPVGFTLEVQWTDGFHALGEEREAIGGAAKAMAVHVDEDMPELSEQAAGEAGEPWDERITLLGGVLAVVKDDTLLKLAYGVLLDEDQALGLMRIAANRL